VKSPVENAFALEMMMWNRLRRSGRFFPSIVVDRMNKDLLGKTAMDIHTMTSSSPPNYVKVMAEEMDNGKYT
jgi:hypothetical protein